MTVANNMPRSFVIYAVKESDPNANDLGTSNYSAWKYNIKESRNSELQNSVTETNVRSEESMECQVKEENIGKHGQTVKYWQVLSVISCFLTNLISGGVLNTYGVLYTYMLEPLRVSEYQLSWIGALMTGFHGIASILAIGLIDSKGCRMTTLLAPVLAASGFIIGSQTSNIYVLYFTLGVLPGIGICFAYTATMVHVNRQFTRWRPFAVSLSVVGTAVGILVWPPLTSSIAEIMGWRGAVLIHGALLLHLVPCALLIKANATKAKQFSQNYVQKNTTYLEGIKNYFEIFRTRGTIIVALGNIFNGLGTYCLSTFIPVYVMTIMPETTTADTALIISLSGIGSVAGRFLSAGVSMLHCQAPHYIYAVSLCLCGLADIAVPICRNIDDYMGSGVLYGIGLGGWNCMASVVYVNLFGIDKISRTLGTFNACLGLGAFCGPPLLSYISSLLGSPDMIFYGAGGFFVIGTVLMLPLTVKRKNALERKKSVSISVVGVRNDGFSPGSI